MAASKVFFIGFVILIGILLVLQFQSFMRVRKKAGALTKIGDTKMAPGDLYRLGLFITVFFMYLLAWQLYFVFSGKMSPLLGIGLGLGAVYIFWKPMSWARQHHPIRPEHTVTLPLHMKDANVLTPDLIHEVLKEECVLDTIKKDLGKTQLIGDKEMWRLGVLSPDSDIYDLSYNQLSREERFRRGMNPTLQVNLMDQVPLKRAAILHPQSTFNTLQNSVFILHGTREPMVRAYPGWSYRLQPGISSNGYQTIRNLKIDTGRFSARGRNPDLVRFLQEDGFPLKDSYVDGDPLTAERGGTIVLDKGKVKAIYKDHFVQSRVIDDRGTQNYLGLHEDFRNRTFWRGASLRPSMSRNLYKCVEYNEYFPIVRYRSFPYCSDFLLPIIDTPMSDSSWADLFIDPHGKGKLYIAKQKSLEEWCTMMDRLKQLFFEALTRKGYHLLALVRDPIALNEYLYRKLMILQEYFVVMGWSL